MPGAMRISRQGIFWKLSVICGNLLSERDEKNMGKISQNHPQKEKGLPGSQ